jgi:hypothetical protein
MAWGTISQTGIFPFGGGGGESGTSGAVVFSRNSQGSVSPNGGTLMWGGASMGGVLSPISVPLEENTHACAEIDGFRRGGAP